MEILLVPNEVLRQKAKRLNNITKEDIKIAELPLTWIHKEGSKVNLIKDSVKFFFDLIVLKIRF